MQTLPISVVIPTFNRESVLQRAVESIRNQSRLPAEIIVVDDGSTDNTVNVATELGVKVFVQKVNGGSGPARNRGVAESTQPWIAFLDSDDEWLPHHLARLWNAVDGYGFASASVIAVADGTFDRYRGIVESTPQVIRTPIDAFVPENRINTSGMIVKRELFEKAGGFRPLWRAQDLDLWIRLLEHEPGILISDVTSLYFIHSQQATTDKARMQNFLVDIVESYRDAPWFTERARQHTRVAVTWDAWRATQARNPMNFALLLKREGLLRPTAIADLLRLLNYRRRVRALSREVSTRAELRTYLDAL